MAYASETPLSAGPALLPDLSRLWPVTLLMGLATSIIGVIVVVWPEQTLTVLSVLLGLQLVIFGLFRLISAFSSRAPAPVLLGVVGVLGMGVGVVVLRNPFESISVLAALLGLVWIVGGAIDLLDAIVLGPRGDRWILALLALVTIVAGIVVVSWPAPTLTVIAWIAGFYLMGLGLLICLDAFSLKRIDDEASA